MKLQLLVFSQMRNTAALKQRGCTKKYLISVLLKLRTEVELILDGARTFGLQKVKRSSFAHEFMCEHKLLHLQAPNIKVPLL